MNILKKVKKLYPFIDSINKVASVKFNYEQLEFEYAFYWDVFGKKLVMLKNAGILKFSSGKIYIY